MPELENQQTSTSTKSTEGIHLNYTQVLVIIVIITIILISVGWAAYLLGSGKLQSENQNAQITNEEQQEPSEEKKSSNVLLGEEVKVNSGLTLVLEKAERDEQGKVATQSSLVSQSELNLLVSFTNKDSIAGSYAPSKFKLKDAEDRLYFSDPVGSKLLSGPLNPGETVRGNIQFKVPSDQHDFKLIYENATVVFSVL